MAYIQYKPEDYEMWGDLADDFVRVIGQRTEIKPENLDCPRAKSDMTPCLARDGRTAMTLGGYCVGCEEHILWLMKDELTKNEKAVQKEITEKYAGKVDFT